MYVVFLQLPLEVEQLLNTLISCLLYNFILNPSASVEGHNPPPGTSKQLQLAYWLHCHPLYHLLHTRRCVHPLTPKMRPPPPPLLHQSMHLTTSKDEQASTLATSCQFLIKSGVVQPRAEVATSESGGPTPKFYFPLWQGFWIVKYVSIGAKQEWIHIRSRVGREPHVHHFWILQGEQIKYQFWRWRWSERMRRENNHIPLTKIK
jgi:hypothetical protein